MIRVHTDGAAVAAIVVLTSCAGVILADTVERPAMPLVAIAGAVCGALAAVVSTSPRFDRSVVVAPMLIGAATAVVAIGTAARWPARGRGLIGAVGDALVYGWAALATTPVPGPALPRHLVPVAVVCCLAAAVATRQVLRMRTMTAPTAMFPAAAPMLVLLGATVAAGKQPFQPVTAGVIAATAIGVLLWARAAQLTIANTRASRRDLRAQAALAALPILASAIVVGGLVGPAATFGRDADAFDPRDHVLPPLVPSQATDPLELLALRSEQPDTVLFTVRGDDPLITRLVTLSTFDGVRWSSAGTFARVGVELPVAPRPAMPTTAVRATIVVQELDSVWLPTVPDTVELRGAAALAEAQSGSVLAAGPATSYDVIAEVATPSVDELATLAFAADPVHSELPAGMPAVLQEMAATATDGAPTPLATVVFLQRYLQLNFAVDDEAVAGQSYGHLVRAFAEDGVAADAQFAMLFATLARAVGVPTRLAVGFLPGVEFEPGVRAVRAADVRVWPEVHFDGGGWVAFDPTPDTTGTSLGVGGGSGIAVQESEIPSPILSGNGEVVRSPAVTVPVNQRAWWVIPAVIVAGLGALTTVAASAIVTLKWRRTRRRRRGTADERVVGAWHDVLERFAEHGVATSPASTVEDVAASDPAGVLLTDAIAPVNAVLYAGGAATDAVADRVWRQRDHTVRALRRSRSRSRRMCARFDPRPLWSASRSRR